MSEKIRQEVYSIVFAVAFSAVVAHAASHKAFVASFTVPDLIRIAFSGTIVILLPLVYFGYAFRSVPFIHGSPKIWCQMIELLFYVGPTFGLYQLWFILARQMGWGNDSVTKGEVRVWLSWFVVFGLVPPVLLWFRTRGATEREREGVSSLPPAPGRHSMVSTGQLWTLPAWWYNGLGLITLVAIGLVYFNPLLPQFVHRLTARVHPDAWSRLIGIYLLSAVVTHCVVFFISQKMFLLLELRGPDRLPDLWSPVLVGVCESIMYPTALLIGRGEFIGVWMALKVAGRWVAWTGSASHETSAPSSGATVPVTEGRSLEVVNEPRRRFNRFLVNNALIIMAAIMTWGALKVWALK